MGFLSSAKVEECSASDLVGMYVGHTGPKTKQLFEKALGQVLFIDEAYRLGEGRFAQEAVDELVGLLTHEKFKSKIVVILAGYENDINRLLSVNSGLSSRFPEIIEFQNFTPKACLEILDKRLQQNKITLADLSDPSSKGYSSMTSVVEDLSGLPSWGNARDMETLAQQMSGVVLKQLPDDGKSTQLILHTKDALARMLSMLDEKRRRSNMPPRSRSHYADMLDELSSGPAPPPPPSAQQSSSSSAPPPPPQSSSSSSTPPQPPPAPAQTPPNPAPTSPRPPPPKGRTNTQPPPSRPNSSLSSGTASTSSNPVASSTRSQHKKNPSQALPQQSADQRDPGVSDRVWQELQAARKAQEDAARALNEEVRQAQRRMQQAIQDEEKKRAAAKAALAAEAAAKDAAARQEAKRQREELERREQAARAERQRLAQALKAKQAEEQRKKKEEAKVQNTLRSMGVCVQGYQWVKHASGYRCAGGSHYIYNAQLGI